MSAAIAIAGLILNYAENVRRKRRAGILRLSVETRGTAQHNRCIKRTNSVPHNRGLPSAKPPFSLALCPRRHRRHPEPAGRRRAQSRDLLFPRPPPRRHSEWSRPSIPPFSLPRKRRPVQRGISLLRRLPILAGLLFARVARHSTESGGVQVVAHFTREGTRARRGLSLFCALCV